MSRFRIFSLFAASVALVAALAACGSDRSSEDPQSVLESATLEGVESGDLDFSLEAKSTGGEGGATHVTISGPFESQGKENLPQLGITAKAEGTAKGEEFDVEGGVTVLPDRAFVNYKGVEYEVDPTTFGFVKSTIEQAQQQGAKGGSANVTGCQEAAEGFKVSDFAENLENEGSADVGGASTTKVSGTLDVPAALDALIKLSEDPACAAELEAAGPLPVGKLEAAKRQLGNSVKKAQLQVYVGDDDIIRKVAGELKIEPKNKGETVEIEFSVSLNGVNEEQEFSAPSGAQPLEELFQKLNINPIELIEGGGVEGVSKLFEAILKGSAPTLGRELNKAVPGPESAAGLAELENSAPESQKAYLECLKRAKTPADLQKCASQLQ